MSSSVAGNNFITLHNAIDFGCALTPSSINGINYNTSNYNNVLIPYKSLSSLNLKTNSTYDNNNLLVRARHIKPILFNNDNIKFGWMQIDNSVKTIRDPGSPGADVIGSIDIINYGLLNVSKTITEPSSNYIQQIDFAINSINTTNSWDKIGGDAKGFFIYFHIGGEHIDSQGYHDRPHSHYYINRINVRRYNGLRHITVLYLGTEDEQSGFDYDTFLHYHSILYEAPDPAMSWWELFRYYRINNSGYSNGSQTIATDYHNDQWTNSGFTPSMLVNYPHENALNTYGFCILIYPTDNADEHQITPYYVTHSDLLGNLSIDFELRLNNEQELLHGIDWHDRINDQVRTEGIYNYNIRFV